MSFKAEKKRDSEEGEGEGMVKVRREELTGLRKGEWVSCKAEESIWWKRGKGRGGSALGWPSVYSRGRYIVDV